MYSDGFNLTTLEKVIDLSLKYSLKLAEFRDSGDLEVKRGIQKMVFPDGILYDFKNDDYRTTKINPIFSLIPSLSVKNKHEKTGIKLKIQIIPV